MPDPVAPQNWQPQQYAPVIVGFDINLPPYSQGIDHNYAPMSNQGKYQMVTQNPTSPD